MQRQTDRSTSKEFKLLAYLLKNPNRVHSRDELLEKIWGVNDPGSNLLK